MCTSWNSLLARRHIPIAVSVYFGDTPNTPCGDVVLILLSTNMFEILKTLKVGDEWKSFHILTAVSVFYGYHTPNTVTVVSTLNLEFSTSWIWSDLIMLSQYTATWCVLHNYHPTTLWLQNSKNSKTFKGHIDYILLVSHSRNKIWNALYELKR